MPSLRIKMEPTQA